MPVHRTNGSSSDHQWADPYTAYTVGISASYEIDFWGKNAAAGTLPKLFFCEPLRPAGCRIDRRFGCRDHVFQALGLQDRLQVARDNLANAENVLKLVREQGRSAQRRISTSLSRKPLSPGCVR
jgi:hypothetical protein